ncbi:MAG TPA: type II toxin-antitoxin system HicA family toxin [Hyphomicrobium sp.]|nr:type II toxin-antitoxin system HicA family toxin [Hyphomicrobium sp.]
MNAQRLPTVDGRTVVRALEKAGFTVVRTSGSHVRLIHATDRTRQTTVPVHKGRDLPRGTLRDILEQVGLTPSEFADLL